MSANNYLCYTYLIGWSKLDLWYYGSRYAQVNRKQNYDLWIDYHTHSNSVKQMRAFIGEPDVIHYDKIFDSIDEARKYESKVLIEHNCKNSSYWLNKNDVPAPPRTSYWTNKELSREHRNKISHSTSGEKSVWFGKSHTEGSKDKMRVSKIGSKNPMYGKPAINRKKVKIYGKIYNSREEASKKLNVNTSTIYKWLNNGKAISL